jgi:hypothetical protein
MLQPFTNRFTTNATVRRTDCNCEAMNSEEARDDRQERIEDRERRRIRVNAGVDWHCPALRFRHDNSSDVEDSWCLRDHHDVPAHEWYPCVGRADIALSPFS